MPSTLPRIPNVSTLNIFLLIGVRTFEDEDKGFNRRGEMSFELLFFFAISNVFSTASFDLVDFSSLLSSSLKLTTYIRVLLGGTRGTLGDGMGVL